MSVMTGFADLDLLLSPDRVHEALGRDDLTVTRVRHKPGQYAVAALADDAGPAGWARVTADLDRGRRDLERGDRIGREVTLRAAGGGLFVATGDLWSDPKLGDRLARLADLVDASVPVRHNPLRRLVLRRGSTQLRVTAEPQRPVETWGAALLDPEAGLTAALRGRAGQHLSRWEWVEGRTVESVLGRDAADDRAAGVVLGRLLARVHATGCAPVASDDATRIPTTDHAGLRRAAADLGQLDPALGARMLAAVDALPVQPASAEVVLHGDYSADQVVLSDEGARLIDLDRAGVGAPARDIASAIAHETLRGGTVDGPLATGLRDGYVDGGGTWPAADELAGALAAALLGRAQEPLRTARPDWRDRAGEVIALAVEVLR